MKRHGFGIVAVSLAAACSTTRVERIPEAGAPPLCAPGVELGDTSVRLATRWRPDQKDPEERERLAREAIATVFSGLRCGRFVGVDAAAARTRVDIELRELGPELTLSLPLVWSLDAHADFTMTATDAGTGAVGLRVAERRKVGGAFVVQTMSAVRKTFEDALRDLLAG